MIRVNCDELISVSQLIGDLFYGFLGIISYQQILFFNGTYIYFSNKLFASLVLNLLLYA